MPVASLTGEAVLYLKLYDVADDGSEVLLRRLVSPVWSEDLSAPLEMSLVGTVHRFEVGHRLKLVIATTDLAYGNRKVPDTYTLSAGPNALLSLPLSPVTPTPPVAPSPAPTVAPSVVTPTLPATGSSSELPFALVALLAAAACVGMLRRSRIEGSPSVAVDRRSPIAEAGPEAWPRAARRSDQLTTSTGDEIEPAAIRRGDRDVSRSAIVQ